MLSRRRFIQLTSPEALLEGLNPEQQEIVSHLYGPLLAGAVAGAGKTTALVRRFVYLVKRHSVSALRILAVTFSQKAAGEMNQRLEMYLPKSGARLSTFHSLCHLFIREELPGYKLGKKGGWYIDDKDKYRTIVKDILGWNQGKGMRWETADLTVVLRFIGLCKANCALAGTREAWDFAQAFYAKQPSGHRDPTLLCEAYQRAETERKNRQLLTFDDMLLEMWLKMTKEEEIRVRWASKWDIVMQDEGQDENPVQHSIIKMLARDHRNYMLVGDPAQSIYAFRGSDPKGLLDFEKEWAAPTPDAPAPKVVFMHRNYRSGSKIIQAANGVLGSMPLTTRLDMLMTAEAKGEGEIKARQYEDQDEEAAGVVLQMQQLHADGVPWRKMVVLYRTNAQSRAMEEECLSNRIPYVVLGGTNFYDRREVKDLLAYLRVAAGRADLETLKRSLNTPFRFLGKAFQEKVAEAADVAMDQGTVYWTQLVAQVAGRPSSGLQGRQKQNVAEWCSLIDELSKRIADGRSDFARDPHAQQPKPAKLLEEVLTATNYVQYLMKDEGSESPENNRVSNVRELVRAAERFPSVDELLNYIEETLAAAEQAKQEHSEEGAAPDRVTMMSIHRSKGLEYEVVFFVGCNDKVIPHARCEDPNEERRLFYVAITRGKVRVLCSYVAKAAVGTRVIDLDPSGFLEEAGLLALNGGESILAVAEGIPAAAVEGRM